MSEVHSTTEYTSTNPKKRCCPISGLAGTEVSAKTISLKHGNGKTMELATFFVQILTAMSYILETMIQSLPKHNYSPRSA